MAGRQDKAEVRATSTKPTKHQGPEGQPRIEVIRFDGGLFSSSVREQPNKLQYCTVRVVISP